MVIGLNKFKEYFEKYTDQYIIIGVTACDIIIDDAGFVPRATKDIDIILIIEALSENFVKKFWQFVKDGKYKAKGEKIDEKHIRKHKTDIFRLAIILKPDDKYELSDIIKIDMQSYINTVKSDLPNIVASMYDV